MGNLPFFTQEIRKYISFTNIERWIGGQGDDSVDKVLAAQYENLNLQCLYKKPGVEVEVHSPVRGDQDMMNHKGIDGQLSQPCKLQVESKSPL